MSQNKVKRTYLGLYVLAFIGVTVIFLMVGFAMVNVLGDYVQTEMMRSATYTARSYSHTMEKNMEAYDTVTELIEEKIETAADTLTSFRSTQNLNLTEWAKRLNVDSIDEYDRQGVVIGSSLPGNIGWVVYEGHPVYEFYEGELERFMGPIRVNTISGREFKYGYYRLESGGFLQIGVSAEHIRSFADDFDMITSFNEMRNGNEKLHLTFLSLEGEVLASTEAGRSGEILSDGSTLEMLERDEETGVYTQIGEEDVYQVYVPVYSEGIRRGDPGGGGKHCGKGSAASKTPSGEQLHTIIHLWFLCVSFRQFLQTLQASHESGLFRSGQRTAQPGTPEILSGG